MKGGGQWGQNSARRGRSGAGKAGSQHNCLARHNFRLTPESAQAPALATPPPLPTALTLAQRVQGCNTVHVRPSQSPCPPRLLEHAVSAQARNSQHRCSKCSMCICSNITTPSRQAVLTILHPGSPSSLSINTVPSIPKHTRTPHTHTNLVSKHFPRHLTAIAPVQAVECASAALPPPPAATQQRQHQTPSRGQAEG